MKTIKCAGCFKDIIDNGIDSLCFECENKIYQIETSWENKDDLNNYCPECGSIIEEQWSGIKCSVCNYWFCY